ALGGAGSTGWGATCKRAREGRGESRPASGALVRRHAGRGVRRLHRPGSPAGVVSGSARLDRPSRLRPARGRPVDGRLRASRSRAVSGDERVRASRPTPAPGLHLEGHDARRIQLRHRHGGHLPGTGREDPDDHRSHRLPPPPAPRRPPGRLAWLPGPAGAGRGRQGHGLNAVTTPRAGHREWIGLAVIALPCLLYSMDLTVLFLAVPHLSAALQPSSTQVLGVADIYGFLVAGMLITMGTL